MENFKQPLQSKLRMGAEHPTYSEGCTVLPMGAKPEACSTHHCLSDWRSTIGSLASSPEFTETATGRMMVDLLAEALGPTLL